MVNGDFIELFLSLSQPKISNFTYKIAIIMEIFAHLQNLHAWSGDIKDSEKNISRIWCKFLANQ